MEWQKIDEKLIKADGYRKILEKTFKLPDGKIKGFEIKKEGDVVCVLPITSDNKIILAKQFRPGPEKILLELPGGALSKEDTPAEGAKKELLEETGYIGDLKFVKSVLNCAYSTRIKYCFIATNCRRIKNQELEESEFIEVAEMPLKEFREHLRRGLLSDADTGYLGLDFLGLL